ncbi:ATP-dependent transcriptional activator malT [Bacillus freudenreichii]|nr:ATP-dependent transcriptional activator malT [Bacillus freudenreichii]
MAIIQSKLRIPNFSPCLKRDRLYSYFEQQDNSTIIAVTGESGYGKTALVADYIREYDIPVVWYHLEKSDSYAHIFLSYLRFGLMQQSDLASSANLTIKPNDVEEALEDIILRLSSRTELLFIVLDDYHCIDGSPDLKNIIEKLFTHSSPLVTFIILSRVKPALATTLRIRRTYKEITSAKLAFTRNETELFFNTLYQLNLETQELDLIFRITEGWVTSYQLIYGIINKMNRQERSLFWSKFPNVSDIFDILSTEILELQDEKTKEFLYKTSLLAELDPAVIERYLNMDNADSLLKSLLKHHLFIFQDEQGIFRYNRLFRQFLYQKYEEEVGAAAITKEHLKIASIYEDLYQFVHAFAHTTIGKDYPRAAKLMVYIRDRYNPIETMFFLDGWLEEISPGQSLANNTLFLIRCIPLSTLNELVTHFEQNIKVLKEKNNQLWLSYLQHRLAYIYFMRGEIFKAKNLFTESLKGSRLFHDYPMTALSLILIAELEGYLGNQEEALQNVRQALFISEKYGLKHTQLQALDTLSTIYINVDKLDRASVCIQQALEISSIYDHSSLVFVYTNLGKLSRKKGNLKEAIEWGEKAVKFAEKYKTDFDIGWSHLHLGESYIEQGRLELAERHLSKAFTSFSLFSYYRHMVLLAQIKLYESQEDMEQLEKKKKELLEFCTFNNFHWVLNQHKDSIEENPEVKMRVQTVVREKAKKTLSIQTLGDFRIVNNNQPVTIKRNSSIRLLQYFITKRNKQINKEVLLEEVFPEGNAESINNQLYVSLSILRKALEPDLKSGNQSKYIVRSENHFIFNSNCIDLDVDKYMILTASLDNNHSPSRLKSLLEAEKCYKGDFFQAYPYEAFLDMDRMQLQSLYIRLLKELANHYYSEKSYSTSFDYFEKILYKDPFQENIYFDYIELLLRQNLISQANDVADKMVHYIEKEMGINVRNKLYEIFSKYQNSLSLTN